MPINIDYTEIVVSELMENAIKYRADCEYVKNIFLDLEISDIAISVRLRNCFEDGTNFQIFKSFIQKIHSTQEKDSLYIERIKEIMTNPNDKNSRFGLYRIVTECSFDLSYRISGNMLEVIAVKSISQI